MLIEMVVSVSGTVAGYELPPSGHRVDLPPNIAADLVASHHAVKVPVPADEEPPVETAVAPEGDVETRAEPAGDDVEALRAQAEAAGVKVDKRWGADRLRDEIAKASG